MVLHGYRQIQNGGCVRLFQSHREGYLDGGQLRDFIDVKDVVDVMLQCLDRGEVSGLFNVGTGRARSFNELIEAIFSALGRTPHIEYIPMPADLREQYQYFTEAKMEKLAKTGLRIPSTELETGVGDYVEWLQRREQSCRNLSLS